ncbi:hypothetical protein BLNAU_7297 [Blattamonas nauphoetae]|uniref:Dynein heavy chain linker domain-containing protein n=1 Tax=Blattamonas nauphoetae TaxID=2049346 RepID=A0ABQ9Y1L8_9EUKA|nr:hypothetical protein BLNAU_7297 [Blattamonas nauphoetae]
MISPLPHSDQSNDIRNLVHRYSLYHFRPPIPIHCLESVLADIESDMTFLEQSSLSEGVRQRHAISIPAFHAIHLPPRFTRRFATMSIPSLDIPTQIHILGRSLRKAVSPTYQEQVSQFSLQTNPRQTELSMTDKIRLDSFLVQKIPSITIALFVLLTCPFQQDNSESPISQLIKSFFPTLTRYFVTFHHVQKCIEQISSHIRQDPNIARDLRRLAALWEEQFKLFFSAFLTAEEVVIMNHVLSFISRASLEHISTYRNLTSASLLCDEGSDGHSSRTPHQDPASVGSEFIHFREDDNSPLPFSTMVPHSDTPLTAKLVSLTIQTVLTSPYFAILFFTEKELDQIHEQLAITTKGLRADLHHFLRKLLNKNLRIILVSTIYETHEDIEQKDIPRAFFDHSICEYNSQQQSVSDTIKLDASQFLVAKKNKTKAFHRGTSESTSLITPGMQFFTWYRDLSVYETVRTIPSCILRLFFRETVPIQILHQSIECVSNTPSFSRHVGSSMIANTNNLTNHLVGQDGIVNLNLLRKERLDHHYSFDFIDPIHQNDRHDSIVLKQRVLPSFPPSRNFNPESLPVSIGLLTSYIPVSRLGRRKKPSHLIIHPIQAPIFKQFAQRLQPKTAHTIQALDSSIRFPSIWRDLVLRKISAPVEMLKDQVRANTLVIETIPSVNQNEILPISKRTAAFLGQMFEPSAVQSNQYGHAQVFAMRSEIHLVSSVLVTIFQHTKKCFSFHSRRNAPSLWFTHRQGVFRSEHFIHYSHQFNDLLGSRMKGLSIALRDAEQHLNLFFMALSALNQTAFVEMILKDTTISDSIHPSVLHYFNLFTALKDRSEELVSLIEKENLEVVHLTEKLRIERETCSQLIEHQPKDINQITKCRSVLSQRNFSWIRREISQPLVARYIFQMINIILSREVSSPEYIQSRQISTRVPVHPTGSTKQSSSNTTNSNVQQEWQLIVPNLQRKDLQDNDFLERLVQLDETTITEEQIEFIEPFITLVSPLVPQYRQMKHNLVPVYDFIKSVLDDNVISQTILPQYKRFGSLRKEWMRRSKLLTDYTTELANCRIALAATKDSLSKCFFYPSEFEYVFGGNANQLSDDVLQLLLKRLTNSVIVLENNLKCCLGDSILGATFSFFHSFIPPNEWESQIKVWHSFLDSAGIPYSSDSDSSPINQHLTILSENRATLDISQDGHVSYLSFSIGSFAPYIRSIYRPIWSTLHGPSMYPIHQEEGVPPDELVLMALSSVTISEHQYPVCFIDPLNSASKWLYHHYQFFTPVVITNITSEKFFFDCIEALVSGYPLFVDYVGLSSIFRYDQVAALMEALSDLIDCSIHAPIRPIILNGQKITVKSGFCLFIFTRDETAFLQTHEKSLCAILSEHHVSVVNWNPSFDPISHHNQLLYSIIGPTIIPSSFKVFQSEGKKLNVLFHSLRETHLEFTHSLVEIRRHVTKRFLDLARSYATHLDHVFDQLNDVIKAMVKIEQEIQILAPLVCFVRDLYTSIQALTSVFPVPLLHECCLEKSVEALYLRDGYPTAARFGQILVASIHHLFSIVALYDRNQQYFSTFPLLDRNDQFDIPSQHGSLIQSDETQFVIIALKLMGKHVFSLFETFSSTEEPPQQLEYVNQSYTSSSITSAILRELDIVLKKPPQSQHNLEASFENHPEQWSLFLNNENPELMALPSSIDQSLSPFCRFCIDRQLFPHRAISALSRFHYESLGMSTVSIKPLEHVLGEAIDCNPIGDPLIVVSPQHLFSTDQYLQTIRNHPSLINPSYLDRKNVLIQPVFTISNIPHDAEHDSFVFFSFINQRTPANMDLRCGSLAYSTLSPQDDSVLASPFEGPLNSMIANENVDNDPKLIRFSLDFTKLPIAQMPYAPLINSIFEKLRETRMFKSMRVLDHSSFRIGRTVVTSKHDSQRFHQFQTSSSNFCQNRSHRTDRSFPMLPPVNTPSSKQLYIRSGSSIQTRSSNRILGTPLNLMTDTSDFSFKAILARTISWIPQSTFIFIIPIIRGKICFAISYTYSLIRYRYPVRKSHSTIPVYGLSTLLFDLSQQLINFGI